MLRVGLTGNIASGKSTVAAVWERLGAPIVDADVLARRALEPGSHGLEQVALEFGPEVLDAAGALDRAKLRSIVFRDARERARLEAIVHPAVRQLRKAEDARLRAAGVPIAVHDVPLLFETGLDRDVDLIVLVDSPAAERLERLVRDRGLDPDEAKRMIAAQMPADRKRRLSDLVIENTGTLADLERKAEAAWREVKRRADRVPGMR